MKKWFGFILIIFNFNNALATTDLLTVFDAALRSDPIYQQAIAQALSDQQNLPIGLAELLPNLKLTTYPQIDRSSNSGGLVKTGLLPRANTTRTYDWALKLKQPVFDYAKFSSYAMASASAKQACANVNAALQNLMLRVTQAYFTVLQDEDNLAYNLANKKALAKQLYQVKELNKAGSRTTGDVYTAQAAYSTAESSYTSALTQLAIDKEFLRTIADLDYEHLAKLNKNFPLISPDPNSMEAWVTTAQLQNWTIKANQYAVDISRANIQKQFAGHLPVVELETDYEVKNTKSSASSTLYSTSPTKTRDKSIFLNVNFPLFTGGSVLAKTKQAEYDLRVSQQQLENSRRNVIYTARQNYLTIVSTMQKIPNDKVSVQSAQHSLFGFRERYKAGEGNIVDLLNQQSSVLQANTQYSADRYAYVTNLISLKNAAGTLSAEDLRAINAWLN